MDAIVAGWVRTPFHRAHKGALAGVRPDTMVAECIKEVVKRLELDPAEVDDVIVGGVDVGVLAELTWCQLLFLLSAEIHRNSRFVSGAVAEAAATKVAAPFQTAASYFN